MCLILPARIVGVDGEQAEIELHGGMRATASLALHPEAAVGQFVLVDRGLVLTLIEAAEAAAIIAMYEEIGQLLFDADTQWPASPAEPAAPRSQAQEAVHG